MALPNGLRASLGRVPKASGSSQGLGFWAALGHLGFQPRQDFGAGGNGDPMGPGRTQHSIPQLGRVLPSSSSRPISVLRATSRAFPDPSFPANTGAAPVGFRPAFSAGGPGPRGPKGCRGSWSTGVGHGAWGPTDPVSGLSFLICEVDILITPPPHPPPWQGCWENDVPHLRPGP